MTGPRKCERCDLCCELIAVPPLNKAANEPCKYQAKQGRGCRVHGTDNQPRSCVAFTCAWRERALPKSQRPDRTGVVIWGTKMLGTNGKELAILCATMRIGVRRPPPKTWRYLLGMSYRLPVRVEYVVSGEAWNQLWQDGKPFAKWKDRDFINLDMNMQTGKLSNPRVLAREDVLATSEDEKRWEETQCQAGLVLESDGSQHNAVGRETRS